VREFVGTFPLRPCLVGFSSLMMHFYFIYADMPMKFLDFNNLATEYCLHHKIKTTSDIIPNGIKNAIDQFLAWENRWPSVMKIRPLARVMINGRSKAKKYRRLRAF
jgi:hypothetical protein